MVTTMKAGPRNDAHYWRSALIPGADMVTARFTDHALFASLARGLHDFADRGRRGALRLPRHAPRGRCRLAADHQSRRNPHRVERGRCRLAVPHVLSADRLRPAGRRRGRAGRHRAALVRLGHHQGPRSGEACLARASRAGSWRRPAGRRILAARRGLDAAGAVRAGAAPFTADRPGRSPGGAHEGAHARRPDGLARTVRCWPRPSACRSFMRCAFSRARSAWPRTPGATRYACPGPATRCARAHRPPRYPPPSALPTRAISAAISRRSTAYRRAAGAGRAERAGRGSAITFKRPSRIAVYPRFDRRTP